METQPPERTRNKAQEKGTETETETTGKEIVSAAKQQTAGNTSLHSSSSSPSHEFSFFTVSLHASGTATAAQKAQLQPFAIDLTPADEIFFHGHLLPLHFLSHLHASSTSPRSSTNSRDSFTLPTKEALHEGIKSPISSNIGWTCTCEEDDDCISYNNLNYDHHTHEANIGNFGVKEKSRKSKPFSLSRLTKWKKASDAKDGPDQRENLHQNQQQQQKKKLKFDLSQFLKRYIKMVKPLLSPKAGRGGRREKIRVRRPSYSFSGALSPRDNRRQVAAGRRGEFSAPASMTTSPTNSGLLLPTAGVLSPASDSTMEELQAAIQAAIAHCKNSIAAQEKESQHLSVPVN